MAKPTRTWAQTRRLRATLRSQRPRARPETSCTSYVYIHQSTPGQVEHNRESTARQYALVAEAKRTTWTGSAWNDWCADGFPASTSCILNPSVRFDAIHPR